MILTKIVLTFGLLAAAGATEVDFMPNDGGELHLFFFTVSCSFVVTLGGHISTDIGNMCNESTLCFMMLKCIR